MQIKNIVNDYQKFEVHYSDFNNKEKLTNFKIKFSVQGHQQIKVTKQGSTFNIENKVT